MPETRYENGQPKTDEFHGNDVVPVEEKKPMSNDDLIDSLLRELGNEGEDEEHNLNDVVDSIMKKYNLNNRASFIRSIGELKYNTQGEKEDNQEITQELRDASFLPAGTIGEMALRQDINMLISQIPEWGIAAQLMCDCVCEADMASGNISRTVSIESTTIDENVKENTLSKYKIAEEKLEINQLIKYNTIDTINQGEGGYTYHVPYAKVFSDLYRYKMGKEKDSKSDMSTMFSSRGNLLGGGMAYGVNEQAVLLPSERSLVDIVQEHATTDTKDFKFFTESEYLDIKPSYHDKETSKVNSKSKYTDDFIEEYAKDIASKITYVDGSIALPVIEETLHDLKYTYTRKYKDNKTRCKEAHNIFEHVMTESYREEHKEEIIKEQVIATDEGGFDKDILPEFRNVRGLYLKPLDSTKCFPVYCDRTVVGYYYISDMTRPDTTERKNGAMSGYTLKSPPSGANDSFSPDKVFYEKLANKIINNFDIKFMRNNIGLHKEIVTLLEAHNFNDTIMRFIFIPAEYVTHFAIKKDGFGRGHSMFEAGLATARMYMFLKLYCLLFQINNSMIRIIKMNTGIIDKKSIKARDETIRTFMSRRVAVNDIFNYRQAMGKITGGSNMIMSVPDGGKPPIEFDSVEPANIPINLELMNAIKDEVIASQPVPAAHIRATSELEFAKEVEISATRLNTFANSIKIDLNPQITELCRFVLRWECDINDEEIISAFRYKLREPASKAVSITNEKIQNIENIFALTKKMMLNNDEISQDENKLTHVEQELLKLIVDKDIPELNVFNDLTEMVKKARLNATQKELDDAELGKNLLDKKDEEGE